MKGDEGMREIKYRAWDIQTESMRDVLVIDWVNELIDLSGGIIERRPHEVILMQFTGLEDKNGVEIFEGDVVKAWSQGVKAIGEVIKRIDGLFIIYPAYQSGEMWGLCPNPRGETTVEIVRNIYENPELLATKKD